MLDRELVEAAKPARPRANARGVYICASLWYAFFVARASFVSDGRRTFSLFDDAMISMTYARNLAHGHGLAWNANGAAVEGITNPLWTLLMAIPHGLGVPERFTSLIVMLVGAALLLGCAVLARRIVDLLVGDELPAAGVWAAGLVAFCYPLVYWTLRGMEVGLVTFGVFALVLLAVRLDRNFSPRETFALAAIAAVLVSTRVDTVVYIAAVFVYLVTGSRRTRLRLPAVALAVATTAALVLQEAWRVLEYHAWLPNTYTLKVGHVPIADRLNRGGRALVVTTLLSLVGVMICAVFAAAKRRESALYLLVGLGVAGGAYSVFVGGDAWEWMQYANRYVTPGLAVLLCAAAIGAADLARATRENPRVGLVAACVACATAVLVAARVFPHDYNLTLPARSPAVFGAATGCVAFAAVLVYVVVSGRRRAGFSVTTLALLLVVGVGLNVTLAPGLYWVRDNAAEVRADADNVRFGEELGAVTNPGATIAVVAAGSPIYFAHRDGVDLLGKSDARIADGPVRPELGFYPGHSKWNYAISILGDRPDVVFQLWKATPSDFQSFRDAGYVTVRPTQEIAERYGVSSPMLVRRGSTNVRWDLLEAAPEPSAH